MKDEEILIQLELQAGRAFGQRDVAVISELFAEEFYGVNSTGIEMTKADVIRETTSPDYTIESFENENIQVRVIGDCAVVSAVCAAKGVYKGHDASARVPYMRIWLKRDDRWQIIAAQSSARQL
jgi:ketosteroid isomerase-like protein